MAVVKGSAQYHLRVMPYRPIRLVFNVALVLFALLAVAVSCYLIGYDHGAQMSALPGGPRDELQTKYEDLQKSSDALRQQITNFKLNAEVDHKATEDIRSQLMQQTAQIAALERDITVYRGMMSTGRNANPQGVSVGGFYVTTLAQTGSYHYKLAIQKLAATDELFEGKLTFKVAGTQKQDGADIPRSFFLHELSGQYTGENIPVSFKYFQNIEGDLALPEGFTPDKIALLIKSSSKKYPATIEKELEWQVSDF